MKTKFIFLFLIFSSASGFAQTDHSMHGMDHSKMKAMDHSDHQDMSWKIVPNETVCMVTEAHFDKPQIPVKVGNKTYYGCCDGCKKTLTESKEARTAVDPVTKMNIDKATAVIAANSKGNVLYFENKKNFETYIKTAK